MKGTINNQFLIATISKTHSEFAQQVGRFAGQSVGIEEIIGPEKFSGGEFRPVFRTEVKGKNVYLVVPQSQYKSPMDMTARVALTAYSCKQRESGQVIAVFSELPFARQDRTQKEIEKEEKLKQEGTCAEALLNTLHANGVDRILTMHMHSNKLYDICEKIYQRPGNEVLFNISPHPVVAHYLMNKSSLDFSEDGAKLAFISPDAGADKFVDRVMSLIPIPKATHVKFEKARKIPNKPGAVKIEIRNLDYLTNINFSFENKYLIIMDDIIDTASTLMATVDWINVVHSEFDHKLGKPKGIIIYGTHAVMAGTGYLGVQAEIIRRIEPVEIITTNTRQFITDPSDQNYLFNRVNTTLRVASFFGDAIVNCCEKNVHPDDYYKFDSFFDLNRKMEESPLYKIKRSESHFLEV